MHSLEGKQTFLQMDALLTTMTVLLIIPNIPSPVSLAMTLSFFLFMIISFYDELNFYFKINNVHAAMSTHIRIYPYSATNLESL